MKNRVPLMIAAGIGLVVAFYFVALNPYLDQRATVSAALARATAERTDFNQTLSQMPQVVQTRNDLQKTLDELNSHLYAKADLARLFEELKSRAGANHLTTTEISPPVSELLALNSFAIDSSGPQFLNLTMVMTGKYLEFGQFINELEKAPYFRGVTAVSISNPVGSANDLQISLSLRAMLGVVQEASL
jgi:Tfp pilus assembly protein PilO